MSGCSGGITTAETKTVTTTVNTVSAPEYKTEKISIEPNKQHVFPIYLKNDQTLHLLWFVDNVYNGPKVWFHIITPSGISLGFYKDGKYANNTLEPGFCQGFTGGRTIFSPSEYGWGEGYYQLSLNTASQTDEVVDVEVQYWVED